MMRNILIAIFLFFMMSSCKEVTFENPQPKGRKPLTSVPRSLQGKYLTLTEEGEVSKDTVVITDRGYYFGYYDAADRAKKNERYEEGVLSDTMILKSYKGYYFLNFNENPEWLLRVMKREKNGDLIYMTLDEKDADFNDFLNKLSVEVRIDSVKLENETLYQIDPSPSKLIELINKGFFTETKLIKIKKVR